MRSQVKPVKPNKTHENLIIPGKSQSNPLKAARKQVSPEKPSQTQSNPTQSRKDRGHRRRTRLLIDATRFNPVTFWKWKQNKRKTLAFDVHRSSYFRTIFAIIFPFHFGGKGFVFFLGTTEKFFFILFFNIFERLASVKRKKKKNPFWETKK